MKQTLLLFFCLLTSSLLHAQNYEPMAIEGAHWVIFWSHVPMDHHGFAIRGDSIVDGKSYKKMYRQKIQSDAYELATFTPPYYIEDEHLFCLLRDDTSEKKVYAYFFEPGYGECDTFMEELIHDYSLVAGDTAYGCLHTYQGASMFTIDSIGSEFLWGKERQVQYSLESSSDFIQGIGGNKGPFTTGSAFITEGLSLLIDYCIGTDEECNLLPVSAGEKFNEAQFRIFPNPATDKLTIELPEDFSEPFSLAVFDLTGQIIHQSSQREIDTTGWPGGLYWLTVKTSLGVSSRKFVKK